MKKRVGITFSQKLQAAFLDWCIRKATPEVCKGYVKRLIEIDKGEKEVEHSRWHITAYKKLMRYLCEKRDNKRACSEFKKVKSRKSNPDNYIPPDDVIKEALAAPDPLGYFYYILIQSGLRAVEAARLLQQPRDCVDLGGYYRCPILWKRGAKQALWAYLIELPRQIPVTIEELHDMRYTLKTIQFKYVRKWVTTKMLLSGMQEIAVDFAQGRVPDSVLRRHYADRLVITDREYRKYAAWLRQWLTGVPQASLLSTSSRQS